MVCSYDAVDLDPDAARLEITGGDAMDVARHEVWLADSNHDMVRGRRKSPVLVETVIMQPPSDNQYNTVQGCYVTARR